MSDRDDNIDAFTLATPAAILAGGGARRMSGADKGALLLGERRLVDLVVERLVSQVDRIIISGRHGYGLGFDVVADRTDGPVGPAAGLWAAAQWVTENIPDARGFITAPVDGPFLPRDLIECLCESGSCAIAVDDNGEHPTFAYWRIPQLLEVLARYAGEGVALHQVARECSAARVAFPHEHALMNINTPEDLKRAEAVAGSV
ncbi:MAG: NTP transferase domain-containing protein [Pseudomonadota bacterium]